MENIDFQYILLAFREILQIGESRGQLAVFQNHYSVIACLISSTVTFSFSNKY